MNHNFLSDKKKIYTNNLDNSINGNLNNENEN